MPSPDLLPAPVFNILPGAYLLLTPEAVIEAVSDDYLAATLTTREQLVGRVVFEAFPDNPAAPEAHGTRNLRASLAQVLATGQPHQMAPQHYDVPDPDRPGHFIERHWLCTNRPALDADGRVTHVLHAATDITARRVTDQQLRESQAAEQAARADADEQRAALGRAFEQAPVSIAILRGPEFIVELANPSLGELWGRPVGPALGRPLFEALPDLAGQGLEELLARALRTGEPVVFQERPTLLARDPAGPPALGYYNFTYQPLHDAQGRVTGLITVGLDVTEQVVARQQVQQLNQELEARVDERTRAALALQADLLAAARQQTEQQARLYQVFEQTPAPVALLRGPGHRFEYVNPAYQAFFPGGQLAGREVADVAPELVVQGFGALLDRVYQTGETYFGVELPFAPVPVNGEPPRTLYFTFTYQAYREDDRIVGVSIFALDVTEQVLARQEREAQRQQLQDLFEQAPVAISILRGPDYVVEVANPLVAQVWGRTPADVLGRPVFEALPEARDQGFKELLDEVRQSGEAFVAEGVAAQFLRGDAVQTVYLNYVYQPLRDADGTITRVAAVGTDVTGQVRDRQQVQELNEQLAASNAELAAANHQLTRTNVDLDNFIYTASHDLRVPIVNIEGLLQAFGRELPPTARVGDVPEMLRLMQDSVDRFKRTIAHLTDVSKLQQAHAQPATQVPLAAVVEEVRLDLLPLLQQTQARLTVNVPADAHLPFSEKNLRSVVYNLLSNALKYRHPDRTPDVQLTYHRQNQHHVLRVQDDGLGFDAATSEAKLYGMFQRLHTHVEGSGIGLHMVKKIVENAGGRIDVASQIGEGTAFTVFFPVHPAS
ncbi:PAS domain-containing protein [Hymenobacter sp. B1770]|uniref:PAS domain-containing protein n=1 Tax=Hymenobacter sp. B1770 TaxID=1718788 RepID=UPI003CEE4C70